jgi:AbrB family looped-hinge helix DNA binding protein
MASVTVTRHSQVTIPKEIREAVGIEEGDKVKMKIIEGNKIMIEKADKEVWRDCTDFLPEDFEKVITYREKISEALQAYGFSYATLDLNGYRMGSMNSPSPASVIAS